MQLALAAVKDSIQYDAFGNIDTSTELDSAYRGRYAWTGRELDVETGLQYNRARYYDSTTGRWISQDPMGFDAGDSNLYRYVKNSVLVHDDASGMQMADVSNARIGKTGLGPDAIFAMVTMTGFKNQPGDDSVTPNQTEMARI